MSPNLISRENNFEEYLHIIKEFWQRRKIYRTHKSLSNFEIKKKDETIERFPLLKDFEKTKNSEGKKLNTPKVHSISGYDSFFLMRAFLALFVRFWFHFNPSNALPATVLLFFFMLMLSLQHKSFFSIRGVNEVLYHNALKKTCTVSFFQVFFIFQNKKCQKSVGISNKIRFVYRIYCF